VRTGALTLMLLLMPLRLFGQGLTPSVLEKPGADSWPTYNGDYSGRRHSPLKQINTSNVHSLSAIWVYRASNLGQASFGSVIKSSAPSERHSVLHHAG
jgi:glucose dehydrogenase